MSSLVRFCGIVCGVRQIIFQTHASCCHIHNEMVQQFSRQRPPQTKTYNCVCLNIAVAELIPEQPSFVFGGQNAFKVPG